MPQISKLIKEIREHGDANGHSGGILDLLAWCQKSGVQDVTEEEARTFLEMIRNRQ